MFASREKRECPLTRIREAMKAPIPLALAALLACAVILEGACATQPSGDVLGPDDGQGRKRLRVLTTNDFHGNLRPTSPPWAEGRPVGGASVLAAYFARAREETDAPTILLDGGDVMSGTLLSNLSYGRNTVEFYNHVGYVAAAIGNHELDWGADTLAARVRDAEFAWLGANIRVAGTDTLPSWSRATHVVALPGCAAAAPACDSVRVGLIGITTTSTPETVLPTHAAPFEFLDEAAEIDRWVPRLRAEGVDFVIVVAHEGAFCNDGPTPFCAGEIIEIAGRLRHRPDLIVSGHTHRVVATRANGIPIVSSGEYGTRFSIVDLVRVSPDSVEVTFTGQPIAWADAISPDPAVAALVDGFEAEAGELMQRVVFTLAEPLERGAFEFPLGNLIVDAMRATLDTDLAIMNTGGIRTSLPAGDVTYEALYRVLPFGNRLVEMELSGAAVRAAVEHALTGGSARGHFSGLRATYDPMAPAGSRLLELTLESGEPIEDGETYTVAVNDFLAEGGDGYDMLLGATSVGYSDILLVDAVVGYVRTLPSPVHAPKERRLVPISEPAPARAR